MDLKRLYAILRETTIQLRKGEAIEGDPELVEAVKNLKEGDDMASLPGGTAHIYAMPHESEVNEPVEKVDLHFVVIGVSKAEAEKHKDELIEILKDWPTGIVGKSGSKSSGGSQLHSCWCRA